MKLYEISKEMELALAKAELLHEQEPDGDHYNAFSAAIDALAGEMKTKACDIASYVKGLKAEAEAIRLEEVRLAERRHTVERRMEWLKAYLASHLTPGEKFGDARVSIGWRTSNSVEVSCEPEFLPPAYQRVKVEADKSALTDALKAGQKIEGVRLTERRNIQIK